MTSMEEKPPHVVAAEAAGWTGCTNIGAREKPLPWWMGYPPPGVTPDPGTAVRDASGRHMIPERCINGEPADGHSHGQDDECVR